MSALPPSVALLLLSLLSLPAAAATRQWPGPVPCDTTLQACVDAAIAGDVIELAAPDPIEENVAVGQSLTIRSAAGVSARFAPFFGLSAVASGSSALFLRIEDIELLNGGIRVNQMDDADVNLAILRARIAKTYGGAAVELGNSGTGAARVHVENNDITVTGSDFSSRPAVLVSASGGGDTDVKLRFNRIAAHQLGQVEAVSLYVTNATLVADVLGNRIEGAGFNNGINVVAYGATGSASAYVLGNLVRGQVDVAGRPGAIAAGGGDGAVTVYIVNNTLVGNHTGIAVGTRTDLGGSLSGVAANNLIVGNSDSGVRIGEEIAGTFANHHNLLHGNPYNEFTPGPGTMYLRPQFRVDGFRLAAGSPGVNAGDNALLDSLDWARDMPRVSVDGLPRIQEGVVDIGAHETGTLHHLHTDSNASTSNNVSTLQWPGVDGDPTAPVLATQNWNPPSAGAVYNAAHVGTYFWSGRWRLFNEGLDDVPQGASFNVLRADWGRAFGHLVDAGNQSGFTTVLDHPLVNGDPEMVLQVAHYWNGHGSTGVYFDAPFGVGYFGPQWLLLNLASAEVPAGAAFTVYAQDPSQSAWRHVARAGETSAHRTLLRHPLLDGKPCAQIQVTRGVPGPAHPIGVFYDHGSGRWEVFNQDFGSMAVGDEFHVVIDPAQIDACSATELFFDGFE